ncbi:MAG: hypothetical protein VXW65_02070 [Pseudomonadota bacterium]|nr:hypothetical protein [Pseudomonadota bacterium]
MKDVQFSLEKINQAHTDLSVLCSVVCSSSARSVETFNELLRIQRNIDSVCDTLENYTDDSRFYEIYEECDLAEKFLTCLILTVWQADKPPITPQQPLDWREANVIYCVMFSAMNRLGNALQAIKAVIV